MKHRSFCDQVVGWHVDFIRAGDDGLTGNYRATLRCACKAIVRLAKATRSKCQAAELDGQEMMRLWLLPKVASARRRRPAKVTVVAPAIPIDKAWVFYWRGIMAAQGHVSRL